jgi:RNA recognition motif-containing protein
MAANLIMDWRPFCSASPIKEHRVNEKLYVGNLDYATTEADLRDLFAQAGTVSACDLIRDRDSGQSKGFAFVTMSTQAEAENATRMFNGQTLGSRALTVNTARPREERRSYGDRGMSRGSGRR